MPPELAEARLIAGLCDRWGYKPDEVLEAPAWILRLTTLVMLAEDDG